MFDFGIGTSELLLIAIVALIVVGPKDLPRLLRSIGQFTRKIQSMAREFQNHLNEAAKESGIEDVKKEVKGMTDFAATTDLDKESSDIKRAIEASAPKPAAAPAEAAKPEAAKPEAAKPEAAKPEGAKPEGDKPEAGKPAPLPEPKAEAERPRETVKS